MAQVKVTKSEPVIEGVTIHLSLEEALSLRDFLGWFRSVPINLESSKGITVDTSVKEIGAFTTGGLYFLLQQALK